MGRHTFELTRKTNATPVTANTAWRETVSTEDQLRGAQWLKHQPLASAVAATSYIPPKVKRAELLRFVTGQADEGWGALTRDPAVAAAMRAVKNRVARIGAEARGEVEKKPDVSSRLLNQNFKSIDDDVKGMFLTSTLHPLYNGEVGWDPSARPWPGRRIDGRKTEPTSLWCSGWGASASEAALDFDFQHVHQRGNQPAASVASLHTRGWR